MEKPDCCYHGSGCVSNFEGVAGADKEIHCGHKSTL